MNALDKFLVHKLNCNVEVYGGDYINDESVPCNCGLVEAREELGRVADTLHLSNPYTGKDGVCLFCERRTDQFHHPACQYRRAILLLAPNMKSYFPLPYVTDSEEQ